MNTAASHSGRLARRSRFVAAPRTMRPRVAERDGGKVAAPMWLRLRRKIDLLTHELRWRTRLTPAWISRPAPPGCRLLPRNGFLLNPEQRRGAARLLAEHRPNAVRRLVTAAERVASGQHYVWGWAMEGPISWRHGLLREGWPRAPFWRLSLEGSDAPGDVKLAWEPSRHVHFLALGRAYTVTNDPRYARVWADQLTAWMAENPPWIGIHWTSPLELAFRVVTWCWSAAHFLGSPELSPSFWEKLAGGIALQLHHIASHLTPRQAVPSNHRLGEAVALIVGSACLPSHPSAGAWRAAGARILVDSLHHGLAGSVVWGEGSTSYHFLALELALIAWLVLRYHGEPVPVGLPSSVACLLEGAELLMPGADSATGWGDDDDYRLCDPLHTGPERGRLAVEAASRTLGEPVPWQNDAWPAALPWLLGPDTAAHPCRRPRRGIRVNRTLTRWDGPEAAVFLFGNPGTGPAIPGHAHADLLSLCAFIHEEPVVLDPGTFTYGGDSSWRSRFRTTGAHGTLVVDGASQLRPAGRFGWEGTASVTWDRCVELLGSGLVSGRHDAYAHLGLTHRRALLFSPAGLVLLRDEIVGSGRHTISQQFLLPESAVCAQDADRDLVVTVGRTALCICAPSGPAWQLAKGGDLGWYSTAYGLRQPGVVACRTEAGDLPATLDTVLSVGHAELLSAADGVVLLRTGNRFELLAVGALHTAGVAVDLPPPVGSVRSDAEGLHIVLTETGSLLSACLIGARMLQISSRPIVTARKAIGGLHVTWDSAGAHLAALERWSQLAVAVGSGSVRGAGEPYPHGAYFRCPVVSA